MKRRYANGNLDRFECAVIGAGPAGATAAYELARLGRRVVLLEKQRLPRYKPCGGGVSPQVQDWLGFDLAPAITWKASVFRCTRNGGDVVVGEIPNGGCVWMVRRDAFDNFLAKQAQMAGTELRDTCEITSIQRQNGGWLLESTSGPLEATYVIAADGSKGQAAKRLGFDDRKRALAGAIEAESALTHSADGVIHLEFGLMRGGYLWNFPKADGHSLGIGAFKGKAPKNLKEILAGYTAEFGIGLENTDKHGHPVAVWDGKQTLHGQNCLLAGEAAALVDPFTAEGIRPSIFSGISAARAVNDCLSGSAPLSRYSETIHEELGKDFAWARRIASIFYAFPKLAYDRAIKSPFALDFLGDLLSGSKRYRDEAARAVQALKGKLLP